MLISAKVVPTIVDIAMPREWVNDLGGRIRNYFYKKINGFFIFLIV
jgi:hypothetical protein